MKPITPLVYRTDELEKTLRRRVLYTAGAFQRLVSYDMYNKGYLQALKDMKIDEKYVEIYVNLVKRVRKSYARVVEK